MHDDSKQKPAANRTDVPFVDPINNTLIMEPMTTANQNDAISLDFGFNVLYDEQDVKSKRRCCKSIDYLNSERCYHRHYWPPANAADIVQKLHQLLTSLELKPQL